MAIIEVRSKSELEGLDLILSKQKKNRKEALVAGSLSAVGFASCAIITIHDLTSTETEFSLKTAVTGGLTLVFGYFASSYGAEFLHANREVFKAQNKIDNPVKNITP